MNQHEMPPAEWTARIGRAVQNARKQVGLSAAKLSERCTEVGHLIPRNTITNLENGRKESVPVHEIVTLARAMGVAPIDLIYPVALDGELVEGHASIIKDANYFVNGQETGPAETRYALYSELARRTRSALTIANRLAKQTIDEDDGTLAMELHVRMVLISQKDLQLAGLPVPDLPPALTWWFDEGEGGGSEHLRAFRDRQDGRSWLDAEDSEAESAYRHPSQASRGGGQDVEHQEAD